jgi:hypothetical protein
MDYLPLTHSMARAATNRDHNDPMLERSVERAGKFAQ